MLKPGTHAPDLHLPTLNDPDWRLAAVRPKQHHLLVFYRGYHCGICRTYVHDLEVALPEFERRGVEVTALSCDTRYRAEMARDEWYLPHLRVAYNLTPGMARTWGLFLSCGTSDLEPDLFSEPGVFLLRPDRTLEAVIVQSTPHLRPRFSELLQALDHLSRKDAPIQGSA